MFLDLASAWRSVMGPSNWPSELRGFQSPMEMGASSTSVAGLAPSSIAAE